jgi:Na+-exporting ATPase
VFVETVLFFAGIEFWKWCKRAYFRRQAFQQEKEGRNVSSGDHRGLRDFSRYTTMDRSETQATGDEMVEKSMV